MGYVSNVSPIINLARIGKLDLLRQLYGELLVPDDVWNEEVVQGEGQAGAAQVKTSTWIKVQSIANKPLTQALQQELDAGEAEAIVLVLETRVQMLVMDERLGRETAQHMGSRCIGLIGILITAKRHRYIHTIKPDLDALRNVAGFRVQEMLYARVLKDEGET